MQYVLNLEKNQFSDFYSSSYREKFIENWGDDVTKMTLKCHKSKNKNLKFDFCFDSADLGSFMLI